MRIPGHNRPFTIAFIPSSKEAERNSRLGRESSSMGYDTPDAAEMITYGRSPPVLAARVDDENERRIHYRRYFDIQTELY